MVRKMVTPNHGQHEQHAKCRILTPEEIKRLFNPHPPSKKVGLIPLVENLFASGRAFVLSLIDT